MLRSGFIIFFTTALTALLPLIARDVKNSPTIFGILLGSFGLGAVLGAVFMQRARARWSATMVASAGIAIYGLATLAASTLRVLPGLCAAMFMAGGAWIMFISLVNVLILNHTPDWVRARVLSVSTLVIQGAVAAGGAAWGATAARFGVHTALLAAGVGTMATTVLVLFQRFPQATVDLTAWNHWPVPDLDSDVLPDGYESGPALITVEYQVDPKNVEGFIQAVGRFGRIRRRDGAKRWGIFRDLENPERYVETFIVSSWAEHLRQHERMTQADRELEESVQRYIRGSPTVRHLLSAAATR
jgi:MFS family permease